MESRARFLGHSIHQSLVAFPVGLLATAVILDLIATFGRYPTAVVAAYWMTACGIVGALVTAWLGGELVARLGVGVHDGAHLDAPSSLDGVSAEAPLRDEPPTASVKR